MGLHWGHAPKELGNHVAATMLGLWRTHAIQADAVGLAEGTLPPRLRQLFLRRSQRSED